jgi:lactoylglutathione lyase
MKLSYTIAYVSNVEASLNFFESAFGFSRKFITPEKDYGELDTGATTLSFASHTLGAAHFPQGYVKADASAQPLGMEIAFTTDDVPAAHTKAIACGATELCAPAAKPWGQIVSYVRSPDGLLVELCTPMNG